MLPGFKEKRFSNSDRKIKVKDLSGSATSDIYDYIKLLFNKSHDDIIIHLGKNNIPDSDALAPGKIWKFSPGTG